METLTEKVILVMDKPKYCDDCPFIYHSHNRKSYCTPPRINQRIIEDIYDKPDWCPLKPIPEEKSSFNSDEYGMAFVNGYNCAIHKIIHM